MEETFIWVSNIIESCTTRFHFECADVLISLYKTKYENAEKVQELQVLRNNKWNDLQAVFN